MELQPTLSKKLAMRMPNNQSQISSIETPLPITAWAPLQNKLSCMPYPVNKPTPLSLECMDQPQQTLQYLTRIPNHWEYVGDFEPSLWGGKVYQSIPEGIPPPLPHVVNHSDISSVVERCSLNMCGIKIEAAQPLFRSTKFPNRNCTAFSLFPENGFAVVILRPEFSSCVPMG